MDYMIMGMNISARLEEVMEKMGQRVIEEGAEGFAVIVERDYFGNEISRRVYGSEYEKTMTSIVMETIVGLQQAVGDFVKSGGRPSYAQRYYKSQRISYSVECHKSLPVISAWVSFNVGKNPQMVADAITIAASVIDREATCIVDETRNGVRWYVSIGFGRFYSEYLVYDALSA